MSAKSRDAKGRAAETMAELYLRLKGYRILARRLKTGAGEIDLISRRGQTLAFIEVKARPSLAEGLQAVGAAQQARIVRAAAIFLAGRPDLVPLVQRFDLIVLRPGSLPRHIQNAWQAPPAL